MLMFIFSLFDWKDFFSGKFVRKKNKNWKLNLVLVEYEEFDGDFPSFHFQMGNTIFRVINLVQKFKIFILSWYFLP